MISRGISLSLSYQAYHFLLTTSNNNNLGHTLLRSIKCPYNIDILCITSAWWWVQIRPYSLDLLVARQGVFEPTTLWEMLMSLYIKLNCEVQSLKTLFSKESSKFPFYENCTNLEVIYYRVQHWVEVETQHAGSKVKVLSRSWAKQDFEGHSRHYTWELLCGIILLKTNCDRCDLWLLFAQNKQDVQPINYLAFPGRPLMTQPRKAYNIEWRLLW